MRIEPYTSDGVSASDLLNLLHDSGIDTHHSSAEYDSHPRYLQALAASRASGRSFEHVVKLASPSFNSDFFDASQVKTAVDQELSDLGVERIASLQWLFRTPDPSDDETRLRLLRDQFEVLEGTFHELIECGKVANVSSFPYSLSFARATAALKPVSALANYLSLFELDALEVANNFESLIAIRPFAGSTEPLDAATEFDRLEAAALIEQGRDHHEVALEFPLLSSSVSTVITSINGKRSRNTAIRIGAATHPDDKRFERMAAALKYPATSVEPCAQ